MSNEEKSKDYDDDLLDFCEGQQNPNTTGKTRREAGRLIAFVKDQGIDKPIHELEPKLLNGLIGTFVKNLTHKKTGKPYEPDTITSYHRYVEIFPRIYRNNSTIIPML